MYTWQTYKSHRYSKHSLSVMFAVHHILYSKNFVLQSTVYIFNADFYIQLHGTSQEIHRYRSRNEGKKTTCIIFGGSSRCMMRIWKYYWIMWGKIPIFILFYSEIKQTGCWMVLLLLSKYACPKLWATRKQSLLTL